MTDEELDAIEALRKRAPVQRWQDGFVSATADGFGMVYPDAIATFEARDRLLAEVRRLKARESLPVIATCGDCSHNAIPFGARGPMCLHGEDDNSRRGRYASRDHAPPSWCPLRKETP
jgi:hypothetical protein